MSLLNDFVSDFQRTSTQLPLLGRCLEELRLQHKVGFLQSIDGSRGHINQSAETTVLLQPDVQISRCRASFSFKSAGVGASFRRSALDEGRLVFHILNDTDCDIVMQLPLSFTLNYSFRLSLTLLISVMFLPRIIRSSTLTPIIVNASFLMNMQGSAEA